MEKQKRFLALCRERSSAKNFAQELSILLGINLDAAYRRIRGSTPLIFNEIHLISAHYNQSFDSVINYEGHSYPFQFIPMFNENFEILQYLSNIESQMKLMTESSDNKFVLTAMDIPFFRAFGYPHLSRFKLFYWQRSVLNISAFNQKKFEANEALPNYDKLARNIYKLYHSINSTEIWSPESLDNSLTQIQYYLDSGLFQSTDSAKRVCDDLDDLLDSLEQGAFAGKKFLSSEGENYSSTMELYQSDVFISNNFIQAHRNGKVYSYVNFNSFNSLMSHSPVFSDECSAWIEQIRVKSILLSMVSEKLRYQFFQGLRKKVRNLRERI